MDTYRYLVLIEEIRDIKYLKYYYNQTLMHILKILVKQNFLSGNDIMLFVLQILYRLNVK